MPALSSPVCLTCKAEFAAPNQLMFYDVVDPSITERCGVLAGIAHAGTDASLPGPINLADFKTYITACNDMSFKSESWSCESVFKVLKVADSLADKSMSEWVDKAADCLMRNMQQNTSSLGWSAKEVTNKFEKLPSTIQHRLATAAACNPEWTKSSAINFLPGAVKEAMQTAALRDAIQSATDNPTKTLTVLVDPDDGASHLKALSALPADPPAFHSLRLVDDASKYETDQQSQQTDAPLKPPLPLPLRAERCGDTINHLSNALRQHTGLKRLNMAQFRVVRSAKILMPAIAHIGSLTSLALAADVHPHDPSLSTTPAEDPLRPTLQALPYLEDLQLNLRCPRPTPAAASRAQDPSTIPRYCIASLLSAAQALTSLHLTLFSESEYEHFVATTPLSLPRLATLALNLSPGLLACFLGPLTAPLNSLHLGTRPAELPPNPGALIAQILATNLAQFTALQTLHVPFPLDAVSVRAWSADRATAVHSAVLDSAPAAFKPLGHLRHLEVAADTTAIARIVEVLNDSAKLVSRLALLASEAPARGAGGSDDENFNPINMMASGGDMGADKMFERLMQDPEVQWNGLLCDLGGLKELRHLEVEYDGRSSFCALERLTALTALVTRKWWCFVDEEDCHALVGMTALQHASFERCLDSRCPPAKFAAALVSLPALRTLAIDDPYICERVPEALRGAAAPWPALQTLRMSSWDRYAVASELVRGVAGLPCVKGLDLSLDCGWSGHKMAASKLKALRLAGTVRGGMKLTLKRISPECA